MYIVVYKQYSRNILVQLTGEKSLDRPSSLPRFLMSAMSASSGLMPLSLISEHKAAQGGPPPVQPLSFASEKHSLVQAPKPTPNGMEPSPPLVPVMPPPQPEAHPSLPCGGVSESTNEEERSGGAVPEVQPLEPPPPTVPAVPEQQPATEPSEPQPAPEPAASKATPSSPQPSAQAQPLAQSLPPPDSSVSCQSAPSSQSSQSPSAVPQSVTSQPQTQDATVVQPEKPQSNHEEQADSSPEEATPESEKLVQPEKEANQAKTSNDPPAEKQKSESHNEQPTADAVAPQPQSKSETAPATQAPAPAPSTTSTGRVSKRTKNPSSGAEKKSSPAAVVNTTPETETSDDKKAKRKRLPTQVYQSPIPELNIIAKMSKIDKTPANDDKLIVFYRNEFLAVRNAEGSFYVCQAMQNVYKTSSRIRIRWLSQVANTDHYSPDFYDNTEFDCILTNLNLERIEKNKYRLPDIEAQRTQSILKRAIDVEKGIAPPEEATVTEEHPDGLDLSLYRNEEQLKKRKKSSRNRVNKKKVKKVIATEAVKKSRDSSRRKAVVEPPKKVSPIVNQQKRLVRLPGKIEKPVVQRIVAAKKMGRRKTVSSPTAVTNKTAPVTQPVKEVAKKKEVTRGAQLKRKSTEPPASAVPDKKVKTGASKTRNL